MKKLGVAIIGYGGVARVHGMAYRAIPFHYGLSAGLVKIVGVADSDSKTAKTAAQELGCGFWTPHYRELLARAEPAALVAVVGELEVDARRKRLGLERDHAGRYHARFARDHARSRDAQGEPPPSRRIT